MVFQDDFIQKINFILFYSNKKSFEFYKTIICFENKNDFILRFFGLLFFKNSFKIVFLLRMKTVNLI